MKREIAIIGYGRFGRLAGHYLKQWSTVYIADNNTRLPIEKGLKKISVREAALKEIIILCVPIRALQNVLKIIAPLVRPGTLVCDVCSVKEQPATWMKRILPKHVFLLCTHPLFGPDSASDGMKETSIVLHPLRVPKTMFLKIKHTLRHQGVHPIEMSPQAHDRLMASTLFLTQFIGRGLHAFQSLPSTPSTFNFKLLTHLITTARHDSDELFEDMYRYNKYARIVPGKILSDFKKLSSTLKK
jgi:prephenate dehydrogenase